MAHLPLHLVGGLDLGEGEVLVHGDLVGQGHVSQALVTWCLESLVRWCNGAWCTGVMVAWLNVCPGAWCLEPGAW